MRKIRTKQELEDFFDFYLYYEQYVKGGRLIYCSECGKLVLTQGNKTQYCKKCQKEVLYKQQAEYYKRKNE